MSSNQSSRDYYHGSSSARRPAPAVNPGQSLPPLRSVLGDQLDLPVRTAAATPYNLVDIYNALPPSSVAAHTYRASGRPSSSMGMSSELSDYQTPHSHTQRPYTYPQSSAPAIRHVRPLTPSYDDLHHPSSSSHDAPYSSSHPSDRGPQKKYVCNWEGCGKRFERQNALDTHMNIHLEQKPFACPVPYCGKVFNVRSNMRRHLLTHKDYQEGGHSDRNLSDEDKSTEASEYYQGSSKETKRYSSSSQYYSSSRRK